MTFYPSPLKVREYVVLVLVVRAGLIHDGVDMCVRVYGMEACLGSKFASFNYEEPLKV